MYAKKGSRNSAAPRKLFVMIFSRRSAVLMFSELPVVGTVMTTSSFVDSPLLRNSCEMTKVLLAIQWISSGSVKPVRAITYWPDRDSYLTIDNNLLRIIETNRAGTVRRSIPEPAPPSESSWR